MPEGEEPTCGFPYVNEWHRLLHTSHVLQRDIENIREEIELTEKQSNALTIAVEKLKLDADYVVGPVSLTDYEQGRVELALTATIFDATQRTALRVVDAVACTLVSAVNESSEMRSVEGPEATNFSACLESVMKEVCSGAQLTTVFKKANLNHKDRFESIKKSIELKQKQAEAQVNDTRLAPKPDVNPEFVDLEDGDVFDMDELCVGVDSSQNELLNGAMTDVMHIFDIAPRQIEAKNCSKVREAHLTLLIQEQTKAKSDISQLMKELAKISSLQTNHVANVGEQSAQLNGIEEVQGPLVSKNSSGNSAPFTMSDVTYSSTTPIETVTVREGESIGIWSWIREIVLKLCTTIRSYFGRLITRRDETEPLVGI